MTKLEHVLSVCCIVLISGFLIKKDPKSEVQYITLTETKVETEYWGQVIETTKYKTRDLVKTITKPDGTKIEISTKETESNDTKSNTQKVTDIETRMQVKSETKSNRSNYSLGIGYKINKGVISFDLSEMVISGKIRLGDLPMNTTFSVGDNLKEYTLGLEIEI